MKPAPLPDWLLRHLVEEEKGGHLLLYWRKLIQEGVPKGERNKTIASVAGHLLWYGVDPDVTLGLLLCRNEVRCRPLMPDDEVVRTVESITRLNRRHEGPFWCWLSVGVKQCESLGRCIEPGEPDSSVRHGYRVKTRFP